MQGFRYFAINANGAIFEDKTTLFPTMPEAAILRASSLALVSRLLRESRVAGFRDIISPTMWIDDGWAKKEGPKTIAMMTPMPVSGRLRTRSARRGARWRAVVEGLTRQPNGVRRPRGLCVFWSVRNAQQSDRAGNAISFGRLRRHQHDAVRRGRQVDAGRDRHLPK